MLAETVAAAVVGLAALLLVLQPLFATRRNPRPPAEPLDPEETPRGTALAALKEIDFDRETGKLSEADYQFLKTKYTAIALEALRTEPPGQTPDAVEAVIAARARALRAPDADTGLRCRTCGPRPEPDAVFCSTCGLRLTSSAAEPVAGTDGRAPAPATIPPNPLRAS
jgi:hypothetical protein